MNDLFKIWIYACVVGLVASGQVMAATETVLQVKPSKTALFDVALRDNTLVAVGERGVVVSSSDAGKLWKTITTPTNRSLTSVAFVSDKVLIAVGHGATLLRSEDAGASWQEIPMSDIGKDSLLGLLVTKDGRVITYGAFGTYLESTDTGKTWQRRNVVREGFDRHISQVIEVNDRLLLVGESGTLAVSDDKGATWSELSSPYQGSYFGALALRDGAMLIFGMRGNAYRSTDGGVSWVKVPIASNSTLNSGSIDANGNVALVGNNGLIATSKDNAASFQLAHAPEGLPLASAKYMSDGTLVYVGYMSTGQFKPAGK